MNVSEQVLSFQAGACLLTFNTADGRLEGITAPGLALSPRCQLWELDTVQPSGVRVKRAPDPSTVFRWEEKTGGALDLHWSSAAYETCVHLRSVDGMVHMTIDVALTEDAVHTVRFPIFGNLPALSEGGERDRLVLPWQNGFLIDNPMKTLLSLPDGPFWSGRYGGRYENDYPAQFSFQFLAYYSDAAGLYFATQDRDAYIKTVGLYLEEGGRAFRYCVTNTPENMGKRRRYSSPYASVFTVFYGDWQTAADIYRGWAIRQKWCPSPIAGRELPEKLRQTDLWRINFNTMDLGKHPEEYLETCRELQRRLDCRLALHWYGWNLAPHDVGYPDYINPDNPELADWPEQLRALNRRFDECGIVKIPYVNGRLWDANTSSWTKENAAASAIREENGDMPDEPWNEDARLQAMCPATPLWRNKVVGFGEKYLLDLGFDGLYVDQIASYNATLCFNENHGHPAGGGTWWASAYRDMVRQLRGVIGPDKILTSESCCEVYADVFDLFLVLDTTSQNANTFAGSAYGEALPLFNMIYGDRMLTYGSGCRMENTLPQFEFNFMRNLLWGILPTVDGFTTRELASAEAEAYLAVIRRALSFFRENRENYLGGRPAAVLEVESPPLSIDWSRYPDSSAYTKTYPGVQAVRWEFPDGTAPVIAYNFLDEAVSVRLDGHAVTLAPHSLERFLFQ